MKKLLYILIILISSFSNAQSQNNIDILKSFGIDSNDKTVDTYYLIDNISKVLQDNFINQGGTSKLFKVWNDMLGIYYPSTTEYFKHCLKPKEGTLTFEPNINQNVNNLQTKMNLDKYGIKYDDKDFPIYMPVGAYSDFKSVKSGFTRENCQIALVKYLAESLDYQLGINYNIPRDSVDQKEFVRGCINTGAYNNFYVKTQGTEDKFSLEVYGGPYNVKEIDFGDKLNWNKIKKILSGEKKYGRDGYNPYEIHSLLN